MDRENIQRLLDRFHSGLATDAESKEIERLISEGLISVEDFAELSAMENRIMMLGSPDPSPSLDRGFYAMLSAEQEKVRSSERKTSFTWPQLFPRFALASLMLVIGLASGYLLRSPGKAPATDEIKALSQQVSELQEMMMLSLLEKGSATERLKAVGLTQEMDEASKKVTMALIQTLNQDENVNVRLAALEALKPYATDSSVREALIRAIPRQDSPLVQISLAELMVVLQEKAAVQEFEKLVESDNTPPEVKRKLKQTIEVLI
jgi:hypothetical protein